MNELFELFESNWDPKGLKSLNIDVDENELP